MMAFMQYAMQIVFAFLMLSMMFIILPRAAVSAGRIADVLEPSRPSETRKTPSSSPSRSRARSSSAMCRFRYPGAEEDVLHDISFTAQPGQTTAFIGSTGSGKSTIVNLIPRFYDVTDGAIYVDGIDIREVTQHDLRDKIGYIPQKGKLFSGTIESNLLLCRRECQRRDAESRGRHRPGERVHLLQAGGHGGRDLPGRHRTSPAARSSACRLPAPWSRSRPSISSTTASRPWTSRPTRPCAGRSRRRPASSTVLIVTQRISTIKNAEQIIVLDEGRIVGKGTHRELMESCETYREIALSQLSKEELA